MSDKYIIRNCPSTYQNFEDKFVCTTQIKEKGFPFYCQNCTDCLLKQIVELCKDYYKNCEIEGNCIDDRTCTSCFFGGGNELAQDILSNLDIQEVE